jgi:hypothetical protein
MLRCTRSAILRFAGYGCEVPEPANPDALSQLRKARKRARTAGIDWIDALYKAYVLGIIGVIAVIVASGQVGDAEVTDTGLAQVRDHGPGVLGALIAAAVCIGVRSGSRGGPLALEAADVRHVLFAPIDRGRALRDAALRQLRHFTVAGAAAGAIAGQLAGRRLPGAVLAWPVSGALVGALAVAAAAGSGHLVAGRRVRRGIANLIAAACALWAVIDLATGTATSPFSALGRVALWPLEFDPLGVIGIVLALGVAVAGLAMIGGLSIEAAERRSALIGRLAFAATLQDLRTVLVLRRQLAQEHPRRKPWLRNAPLAGRWPVWDRGWRGVLRWPLVRVVRIVVLGFAAGAALAVMDRGTTPLVVVAALALFVAGLDAVEALAQEVDHPSRGEAVPIARGALHLRHLAVAVAVMIGVGIVGLLTTFVLRPEASTLEIGAITVVTAALGSVAGAAISTVAGPPDPLSGWAIGAPEIAGVHNVVRLLWPPGLAMIGCVPPLVASRVAAHGASVPTGLAIATAIVLVIEIGVFAWVHARDSVLAKMEDLGIFGKPS